MITRKGDCPCGYGKKTSQKIYGNILAPAICMNNVTLTGIAASIFTAASLLPQLTKVIKEKKAEDVSLWMLLVLFVGLGLWVYYGFLKNDMIIIISNLFSFIVNILLAGFAIKYKKK